MRTPSPAARECKAFCDPNRLDGAVCDFNSKDMVLRNIVWGVPRTAVH